MDLPFFFGVSFLGESARCLGFWVFFGWFLWILGWVYDGFIVGLVFWSQY